MPDDPTGPAEVTAQLANLLGYMLRQYERLVDVHALVVMDTEDDRRLHAQSVAMFREAMEPVQSRLAGWRTTTATPHYPQVLRDAAAGRREYAARLLAADNPMLLEHRDTMRVQADTLDGAAAVLEGEYAHLYSWLPSWRWDLIPGNCRHGQPATDCKLCAGAAEREQSNPDIGHHGTGCGGVPGGGLTFEQSMALIQGRYGDVLASPAMDDTPGGSGG